MRYYNPFLLNTCCRDGFVKFNLFLSLLLNTGLWAGLFWRLKGFSESVPLHYNIYFGIDRLGPYYQLFFLPFLGLLFILINFSLGAAFFSKEKLLSQILAGVGSFSQLIFILASIFILLVNI
ncbi:MAG: hypothetical protein A3J65_04735 [Candidatus Buchananbacteria bacterium RIFCSPHIGHO2_02_FULL_45_11b]|uniref:DUF1648 domain-containing protein n=4 Tax=Candidatus Buchananiibacteriota TaxID=1817903 RepID=A0A1G1Y516_9BACT|nr:MAG: hypothetical protein A2663_02630 [Candidatus Buchananbacteria bacterium RIFCSPHIGHO2_01_FULL_46_12]OGY52660.1 MAG: hypothetical protein A3J65_04735 [Candidatus Buchananbacteria bacterium RIFCSPHIGHO2_02_FULL_45_11b]OGY52766.1 MAG: hypothetical protein A3B15_03540 [Candidatus Buchananbacteria bacterium RIFCSPLOWO2_01_FULL_45_31]OGY58266.1 MAG: hypothetical protein A3H67_04070 [Candidatus Buchananbacteria bacterium RIFCSPLOWO2_02_FULL_46_11b]